MLKIEYNIIVEFDGNIENISDEEICYNFLLGNVSFSFADVKIEMDWEWIPLLDFAYCMQIIVNDLKVNDNAKEYFEFTENTETIGFFRKSEQLKIVPSFSILTIEVSMEDFEKAVCDFHFGISEYIRRILLNEKPPKVLQKYLSVGNVPN